MNEIWKPIVGYEGLYEVSSFGRVKSLSRIILIRNKYPYISKELIIKKSLDKKGYFNVCLSKNGKQQPKKVHVLVAESFLNHKPCGYKLVVNHIDINPKNNNVENLEVVTARENCNQKHLKSFSKYTGVVWTKKLKKWNAQITINKKCKNLGYFDNELEASQYYENALKAHLNNEEIIVKKAIFSSNYKGVCWNKNKNKWTSTITINGKSKHLGLFETELEAHQAYQNKLLTLNK